MMDSSPVMTRRRGGFTLIELLVVVAIIALLISILLPSLGRAKELANRVYCSANLRGMAQSLALYAEDYSGTFPTVPPPGGPAYVNSFKTAPSGYTTADATLAAMHDVTSPSSCAGSPIACLWILALQKQAPPKMLLCKSDRSVVTPAQLVGGTGQFFANFQDQYQVSYSITYPWAGTSTAPNWRNHLGSGIPIMSDMAPLSRDGGKNTLAPRGSAIANSANHENKGQNVSYGDTHVEWQKETYVSDTLDNMFTVGPVASQADLITLNVLPALPTTSDTVMVPVRRTSDGAMGN